jgi:hypothetical protein
MEQHGYASDTEFHGTRLEFIEIADLAASMYATQVGQQALKDASENARAYLKGHGIKIDKKSILSTTLVLP